MTTDTALAKISLEEKIAFIRPFITGIPHGEMFEAILATLQSIKDAGDDVVEPELWGVERDLVSIKDYDTLLSAYKRAQQEKKTVIDVYEGNLREADKRLIFWQERAEKAESEREQFRKDAERYVEWRSAFRNGECALYNALCDAQTDSEHDAAIDSARNK